MKYVLNNANHKPVSFQMENKLFFTGCILDTIVKGTISKPTKSSVLFTTGPKFYVNQIYKNYQSDKNRFRVLDFEDKKNKLLNTQIPETPQSPEKGKRMSLNNGIFKENDDYKI